MTTANDARRAHELLDELDARAELSQEQEKLLRSFLPELPKQKTLEEINEYVDDAWSKADDPESKEWLHELHAQLKGLKDTPADEPENVAATVHSLPAGMRLADHEVYGRVVVSPKPNDIGQYKIFHLDDSYVSGADVSYVEADALTFIDAEPAKPAHPEFLETEADYQNAPEGTIVACDDSPPCHKFGSEWSSILFYEMKDNRGMSRACRRVLRWGNE